MLKCTCMYMLAVLMGLVYHAEMYMYVYASCFDGSSLVYHAEGLVRGLRVSLYIAPE